MTTSDDQETCGFSHDWDGYICTKCGVWHTGDIKVHDDISTNYPLSLTDKSLHSAFRYAFPSQGEPIIGKQLGTIAHAIASLYGALDRWRHCAPDDWRQDELKQL